MARQYTEPTVDSERHLRMSYEEYAAWTDEDTFSEWVDGEVTVFMPPDVLHNGVALFLASVLNLFVDLRNLGKILPAPFEMKLRGGRSYREPDLLFVSHEHLYRLDDQRLNGPADLAIEIISDESVARDRREKFAEYALAGIQEYWLVDAREGHRAFSPYRLTGEGTYEEMKLDDRGRFHSAILPGLWLDPTWLTQDPILNALEALIAIAPDLILNYIAELSAMQEKAGDKAL
jgi:Uma2 family endonuclease